MRYELKYGNIGVEYWLEESYFSVFLMYGCM